MKQGIIRTAIIVTTALVMISAVFLTGPRSRITDSADADFYISDGGSGSSPGSTMPPEEPEEQKEEEKPQEKPQVKKTTTPTNRTTPNNKVVKPRNGNKKGSGSGNNGKGNGNGNGNGNDNDEEKETINVKLDPNGGSCEQKSIKVSLGGKYGSIPAATRSGYTFAGWFTAAEDGTEITANTKVTQTAAHTIYAHWNRVNTETYTITFDPNGGRISNKNKTRKMQEGGRFASMPVAYNDGQELEGWFTDPEDGAEISEGDTFDGKGDLTLYARWNRDPYTYWSFKLKNTTEKMYACQTVGCYIEFEDNITASKCALLSDCKAENVAMNRGSDTTVTDEWVEERRPDVIIKCSGSGSNAGSLARTMQSRFPGRRVLVIPSAANSGSGEEQLYYKLLLGSVLYPSWFGDIDIGLAGEELGVSGNIYE